MASGGIEVTPGRVFGDTELVTPAKLNDLGLPTLQVQEGAITARELADGSISSDKLDVDLSAQLSLADGSVTTAKLDANAVTSAKLADDAVIQGKVAPGLFTATTAVTAMKAGGYLLLHDPDASDVRAITVGNAFPSGSVVQTVYYEEGSCANVPTQIPYDDTIPQVTEGNEIATAAITPKFSDSKVLVEFTGVVDTNPNDFVTVALFRNGATNAIAAAGIKTNGEPTQVVLRFRDAPATTSATTYSIRAGADGASTDVAFNGVATPSRRLGGVAKNVLLLQELRA